jgi:hypothetical protein
VRALLRVVEIRERRVVELQVGAAELAQARHLLRVRVRQVVPERVELGIHVDADRGAAAAVVQHAR